MTDLDTQHPQGSTPFETRPRPARKPRREVRAPRPRLANALALIAGVGFVISIGLAFVGQSLASYGSAGGWWTLAGRLTGLTGTYLLIIMVLLVTRLPWLEETVGRCVSCAGTGPW